MQPISIKVKCFKKRPDGTMNLYFDSNTTLNSGLFLYDVFTLTMEHFKDVFTSSSCKFILDVCVECGRDFINGHTIINPTVS